LHHLQLTLRQHRLDSSPALLSEGLPFLATFLHERHDGAALNLTSVELRPQFLCFSHLGRPLLHGLPTHIL